ncbi:SH3-like domain-containing protein [Pelagibius sp.]|uniref:SH3-like domain-containing protein n=1 Tax=Pelagibius sp. TaxID=1931238 RepID=UPI00260897B6|nr:SH3-like domain-containing protein [Pelagibius sp.]
MTARFEIGARVAVRAAYPPGHVRTPFFVRGKTGVVTEILGPYRNPEALAYGRSGDPALPLYRILFRTAELWDGYEGSSGDTTVVDIYENWLSSAEA